MAGNIFGSLYRLMSFGESHGAGVGGVIEGVTPGIDIDIDFIQQQLDRRRPGQSKITTPRDEKDRVTILSGVFEGKATGTPIGFVIHNTDQRSHDYGNVATSFRPSHADYTYDSKYGLRDYRGGGRSSARETIARVVAGAVARLMLREQNITIQAYTSAVGPIKVGKHYSELDLSSIDDNIVRCADQQTAEQMIEFIDKVRLEKDSVGGVITCVIKNVPAGWGEPVFDKLHAMLGHAMLSINAVKGFEYGSGFEGTTMLGSQHNDRFIIDNGKVRTTTNHSGGIQGGISNGEDIYFNVAFKPIATILKEQKTVDNAGNEIDLTVKGRHDPCVLPRAVPIVEAMAAMVLADMMLLAKTYKR
jgi:chorismate synthase